MTYLVFAAALALTLISRLDPPLAIPVSIGLLSSVSAILVFSKLAWRPPPGWELLLGASSGGLLQASLGYSSDPTATIQISALWLSLSAVYATSGSLFASSTQRLRFLQLMLVASSVLAAIAIVQPYAGQLALGHLAAAADESVGPFASRNAYASFVLLTFPVAGWAARTLGSQWWLSAGLLLASAFVTGSRSGAALALAEAAVLCFWFGRRAWLLPTGAAALAGLAWGGDALRIRLGYSDPLVHRREIYASSLELLKVRPFTGWGLGSFESVYPAHATFDVGAVVTHAHNDLLEAAVEGGLIYGALVLGCLLMFVWRTRRSAWAVGLPIVALHSLVDFPFQRPGILAWFVLLAAAARAESGELRNL